MGAVFQTTGWVDIPKGDRQATASNSRRQQATAVERASTRPPACAPNTVDVGVDAPGHVVVDDRLDVIDVQATAGNVGGNQYVQLEK